jgi:tetratricopeptide (TPR) repeat protein
MTIFIKRICWWLILLVIAVPAFASEKEWNDLVRRAFSLQQQGKAREALELSQKALEMARATFPPDHPAIADSLNNLGFLYKNLGQVKEAEPFYREALTLREKIYGPDHLRVASSLHNMAFLYQDLGRYEEGIQAARRALTIREKNLGPEHADAGASLSILGMLHHLLGRLEEAGVYYHRSLNVAEKAFGPIHPLVAVSLKNLAALYQDLGRQEEAAALRKQAEEITKKLVETQSPRIIEKSGKTLEEAVIIMAQNSKQGIQAEYDYLNRRFGLRGKDWKLIRQSLMREKDKVYDKMDLEFPDGTTLTLYFDITSFFGKL